MVQLNVSFSSLSLNRRAVDPQTTHSCSLKCKYSNTATALPQSFFTFGNGYTLALGNKGVSAGGYNRFSGSFVSLQCPNTGRQRSRDHVPGLGLSVPSSGGHAEQEKAPPSYPHRACAGPGDKKVSSGQGFVTANPDIVTCRGERGAGPVKPEDLRSRARGAGGGQRGGGWARTRLSARPVGRAGTRRSLAFEPRLGASSFRFRRALSVQPVYVRQ